MHGLRYTLVNGSEHHDVTEGIECTWLNGQVGGGAKTPPLLPPPAPAANLWNYVREHPPYTLLELLASCSCKVIHFIFNRIPIPSGRDWANLFKPFDHFSCLISALMDKKMKHFLGASALTWCLDNGQYVNRTKHVGQRQTMKHV